MHNLSPILSSVTTRGFHHELQHVLSSSLVFCRIRSERPDVDDKTFDRLQPHFLETSGWVCKFPPWVILLCSASFCDSVWSWKMKTDRFAARNNTEERGDKAQNINDTHTLLGITLRTMSFVPLFFFSSLFLSFVSAFLSLISSR